jgi:hypothetical protein
MSLKLAALTSRKFEVFFRLKYTKKKKKKKKKKTKKNKKLVAGEIAQT